MIHVGIDPGKKGAIALISEGDDLPVIYDMPLTIVKRKRWAKHKREDGTWGRSKRWMEDPFFDTAKAAEIFRSLASKKVHITLEKIQLWGQNEKAGTNSLDTFLKEYGQIKGMLQTLGFSFVEVSPTSWQNFLEKPEHKDGSMLLAKYFYPKADLHGPRGGDLDGRADALLIAHYDLLKFPSSAN